MDLNVSYGAWPGPTDDASRQEARVRLDRISDPKIKTSIEIIIRSAYSGQVRETNGVDPQNIPMASRGPTGFSMVLRNATEWVFQWCVCLNLLGFYRLVRMSGWWM